MSVIYRTVKLTNGKETVEVKVGLNVPTTGQPPFLTIYTEAEIEIVLV